MDYPDMETMRRVYAQIIETFGSLDGARIGVVVRSENGRGISACVIARRTGFPIGKTLACLCTLMDKGVVEKNVERGVDVYRLTDGPKGESR